ncbi:MAG: tetratricopeptide repeat protein [Proteobacteria bacterium]|nr:tetratricopeptide repeat protein [Pseudomonadota bacterium]
MTPDLQTPEQISSELMTLWNSGQLAKADALIKQGLARFPDHPQLLSDAGVIADKLGKNDEAIKYFEQAHELVPQIPLCFRNYLVLLSMNNDTEKIVEKTPEILRLFGDDAKMLMMLAAACVETGADDRFFEVLRSLHELEPNERRYLDDMAA